MVKQEDRSFDVVWQSAAASVGSSRLTKLELLALVPAFEYYARQFAANPSHVKAKRLVNVLKSWNDSFDNLPDADPRMFWANSQLHNMVVNIKELVDETLDTAR